MRGTATAPAMTPPVVARKFLRVVERRPEEFDIEFLNVEFKNRPLYAHVRAEVGKNQLRSKKLKPPFGGFSFVG
jgi:hypothetical protein